MVDDPNKRRVDGWFVSVQAHDYEYVKTTAARFEAHMKAHSAGTMFHSALRLVSTNGVRS